MDYLKHNSEEHEKAKDLAKQIENATDSNKKRKLFEELYIMIYAHHKAEEDVVFPAIMEELDSEEDKEVVREMIEEHSIANYQFTVINKTGIENETWNAKFSVLNEILEHHMDEEEDEFGKVARKAVSEEKREELLKEFEKAMDKREKEKEKDLK